MEECKHGIVYGPCSYCTGRETTWVVPKRITVAKSRTRARIDPDMVVADRVARGEICEQCLGETAPIGCTCSRQAHFTDQLGNGGIVRTWLKDNHGAFMPPGTTDAARALRTADRAITGLAFSTLTRASRRAGVPRDDVMDPDGELPAVSVLQDMRLTILDEFGVEPKWHAARTQEADYSPV